MKILTNTLAISGEILDIINHSKNYLYLMSPYVQFEKDESPKFFIKEINAALKNAIQKHVKIFFITRGYEANKENIAENILKDFIEKGCELSSIPNLHAKIYSNESKALITSMNMYLYSVLNNTEIGVSIDKENDLEVIREYIENVIRNSQKICKEDVKPKPWKDYPDVKGYCIICNNDIEFDPGLKQMVCNGCIEVDKIYYNGPYCHICGKKEKDSSNFPLCKKCWYQYKSIRDYGVWSLDQL